MLRTDKVNAKLNGFSKMELIDSYNRLGAEYERKNQIDKAIESYRYGIQLSKRYGNKEAERELSYTLLGLIE